MEAINIGKRLEVFWDGTMIDHENTGTTFNLHHPIQRECVLIYDDPWGGDFGAEYTTVLRDGDVYRLYSLLYGRIVYNESKDGIHWYKPIIGEYDFNGSKENNILDIRDTEGNEVSFDGFRPFIDENPACKPEERYKMAANLDRGGHAAVVLFGGPDGIHFRELMTLGIKGSTFDSVNTVFYNPLKNKYEAFVRDFHMYPGTNAIRWIRDIKTTASETLEGNWPATQALGYEPLVEWEMYINSVMLYPRAKHIYIGFPLRYLDRNRWHPNFDDLCGLEKRLERYHGSMPRCGTAITDTLFMTSRDGHHWQRYADTFLTPGPEHETNWVYYSTAFSNGLVETKSLHPGCDDELSFYSCDNRWTDKPAQIYRYSIRMDGFVSQRAPWYGTNLRTKRLIFDGSEMYINFSTSVYGGVTVTIRDDDGNQIRSIEMFGDSTNRKVRFEEGNLAGFAGKPVTVDFAMRDADLYSMRFN